MLSSSRHPTIAVLMPVHNAEPYVASAIESIRAQSFEDFELILLDDGSTDGSLAEMRRQARQDSRITLISRSNTGIVGALNEMLAHAKSPLLARMDADDIALPDRFKVQVEFMEQNAEVVCLGGGIELIDSRDRHLLTPPPVRGNDQVQAEALCGRTPISHPAAMMRADAVRAVGGYHHDSYPAEDLDLFLRLGEMGKIDNVPDLVLRYRVHSGSISVRLSDRQIAKMREACQKAWQRRGVTGKFRGTIEAKPSGAYEVVSMIHPPILHANPTAQALSSQITSPAD